MPTTVLALYLHAVCCRCSKSSSVTVTHLAHNTLALPCLASLWLALALALAIFGCRTRTSVALVSRAGECGEGTPRILWHTSQVLGWSHENALNNTMDTFVSKTLRASHSSYAAWAALHNTYTCRVYIWSIVYSVCATCCSLLITHVASNWNRFPFIFMPCSQQFVKYRKGTERERNRKSEKGGRLFRLGPWVDFCFYTTIFQISYDQAERERP